MTTVEERRRVHPRGPGLPELTPKAEVALLARALNREGYDDHLAGHITYRQPDDTLLVSPFGLTWDEVRASDVMTVDLDGNILDGPWDVHPAVTLHVELHRARHDVTVAVHNHPRWGTLWADAGRVPPVYDQTGALVAEDPVVHKEFDGTVDARQSAANAIRALGSAPMALLANHGVLIVADSIAEAHNRSVTLEWRCRQAWHLEAVKMGIPMDRAQVDQLGTYFRRGNYAELWWTAMARKEIRLDPSVME
ncbi:MAG TPA: class II aldolase/adducin family protein [Acidimicrobiales bacterium]|nr:class II aldolase/adducin family protein [Acidimicrobiales bacterium]